MKKSLSIILSILMAFSAFSVMPFNAFAEETDYYAFTEETDYYLVGDITGWRIDEKYLLTQDGDEYVIKNVQLKANDEFKVESFTPNIAGGDPKWYPDENPNYKISADGIYDIYLNPQCDGGDGWYYGCLKVEESKVDGSIGDNAYYLFSDDGKTLTIFGTGATWDYDLNNNASPFKSNDKIKAVVIEEGITKIGKYLFHYCNKIESVSFPSTLITIGNSSFEDCRALEKVSFPEKLEAIDSYAFDNCESLTEVVVPVTVTTLGGYVFQGCTNLKTAVINAEISEFKGYSFYCCTNLKTLFIKKGISKVDGNCFSYCDSLSDIYYTGTKSDRDGMTVSQYGSDAFTGATWHYNSAQCGDNVFYGFSEDGETLSLGGTGATWDYTADETTWKSDSPFFENRDIKTIIVGDGITSLGNNIFNACYNVTSITLPEGLTSIGYCATTFFEKMESIDIPSTVTSLGVGTFSNWQKLKSVTIPEGVTSIPKSAFYSCFALKSLTLPQNITSVGDMAFLSAGLNDLFVKSGVDITSSELNSTANVWRYEVLANQTGAPEGKTLVKITAHDQGTATTVPCNMNDSRYIVDSVDVDGVTVAHNYNNNKCTVCGAPKPTPGINVSVEDAFLSGTKIPIIVDVSDNANGTVSTTVNGKEYDATVSDGAACIDVDAQPVGNYTVTVSYSGDSQHNAATSSPVSFYVYGRCGENAYYRVTGENNDVLQIYGTGDMWDYNYIDGSPFADIKNITSVTVENGVTGIGECAFYDCFKYPSINPNTNPESAPSVTLADSVAKIGSNAFESAYIKSINIPGNVKTISNHAFSNCNCLTSVTVSEGVETIGQAAFTSCKKLPEISLPSTLKTISTGAFKSCYALTAFNIPAGVETLGDEVFELSNHIQAFSVDKNNKNFTAKDGVIFSKDMKTLYFYPSGKEQEEYTVPGTVTTLHSGAFVYISAELQVLRLTKKITTVEHNGLYLDGGQDIYFGGTESDWQALIAGAEMQNFGTANVHFCEPCGDNVYYYYTDDSKKNLVLFGSGDTWDYNDSDNTSPFYNSDTIEMLTVGDGITRIGDYMFSFCQELKAISLPDTVTSLGDYTFENCMGLDNLTLPDNITEIGADCFAVCMELDSITLPAKLEKIGDGAFSSDSGLGSIIIPESVKEIGKVVFINCEALQNVNIPKGVTTIGTAPFYSCDHLTAITVDADNQNYCADDGVLFNKDKTLLIQYPNGKSATSYTVPETVTTIGEASFAEETDIKEIVIPKTVSSIEKNAFGMCTSLNDVYYVGTKSEWEALSDSIENGNNPLTNATIHYTETVSFNANGGTGNMAPYSAYTEFTYALPACTFVKDGRTFYKWQVGDELKDPTDEITVNDSVEVKAIWQYSEPEAVDFSVDKSTTTVTGELILKDTSTGKVYKKNLSEVAASSLDEPLNADASALIEKTKTALRKEAAGIAGSFAVKGEPNVADAVSGTLVDNRTDSLVFGYDAELPAGLEATDENGDFKYYSVTQGDYYREHTVKVTLNATFTSDRITDAEKAEAEEAINAELNGTSSAKAVTIYWGKVKKADKIVVYAAYCGKAKGYKKIATLKGDATKYDITKLNGKPLNQKKNVKAYVVAYRKVNGKYKKITKSLKLHVAGYKSKRTNTKEIKLKKSKFTLNKGKTAKIKGSIVLEDSKKKPVNHVKKLRFKSSNKKVAKVTKSGKIIAKGKGTCTIYVFANNGMAKKVKVVVK